MGERWYQQRDGITSGAKSAKQASPKADKPKRRLKADIVKNISNFLGKELKSLDKMTVADLTYLEEFLENP